MRWFLPVLVLAVSFVFVSCNEDGDGTQALYAVYITSFDEDLSTDWQINYLSAGAHGEPYVYYDTEAHFGEKENYKSSATGISQSLKAKGLTAHHTPLTDLKPDTVYYFITGDEVLGYSQEMKFRTPPAQGPVRFVAGGDMGTSEAMAELVNMAAKTNPDFAVVGGDIAYANGKRKYLERWIKWLSLWQENAITGDGMVVPLTLAIGNHEVNNKKAPYWTKLFHQHPEGRSYFSRLISDHTHMMYLDTGHITSHKDQVPFINREAERFNEATFKLAVYHVPLYPSHRDYDGRGSKNGRNAWLSAFDSMPLDIAFENHDHTFKRTKRLQGNSIVEEGGTLYLGDGAWGRGGRTAHPERWYLEKAQSKMHFWKVDVSSEEIEAEAIGMDSELIDQVVIPKRVGRAPAEFAVAN